MIRNRSFITLLCAYLIPIALLLTSGELLAAPNVVITPSPIDFGVQPGSPFGNQQLTSELTAGLVGIPLGGSTAELRVQVRNVGPGPLTLRSVHVIGASLSAQCPEFLGGTGVGICQVSFPPHSCGQLTYLGGNIAAILPIVLQEGATCDLSVFYNVEGLGDLLGTLSIESDSATSPDVVPITAVRQTTVFWGIPATDSARATVVVDGLPDCGLTEVTWLPPPGQQDAPPKGFAFPHGLLHFDLRPCVPGATKTLHLDFANPLPMGTKYLKFGPTPDNHSPHWYEVPSTVQGTTIHFSITDGGLGDDDLIANGVIVDQGGPAVPVAVSANPTAVPTLSTYALIAMLMGLIGVGMNAIARRGIKR